MPLAKVPSLALRGIEAVPVEVEVDLGRGLPGTVVLGLPGKAVNEARDRVKAAVLNSGFEFPVRKITVNLAPADLRKEGPAFDLPIALGVLAASGALVPRQEGVAAAGELTLEGRLRPVRGVLAMALACRRAGIARLLVPTGNLAEVALVPGVEGLGASTLAEAVGILAGTSEPVRIPAASAPAEASDAPDLAEVQGQDHAKRALVVAAAGGHNLILLGPPGSGKTMLARRLPGLLPPLEAEEALEVTCVHSVAGELPEGAGRLERRPFRAPHHTSTLLALAGGGAHPRPGEVTLAHRGVLFLDELPEFSRRALEVLRQPLEEGRITIGRASGSESFPAGFMLVAAMNPCPCGFHGDPERACRCTPQQAQAYLGRVSGPLLDRIDLHLEVRRVPSRELTRPGKGLSSAEARERVLKARERQARRFRKAGAVNARMTPAQIKAHCSLLDDAESLLRRALDELKLSARAYHRILKVARTLADLDASEGIRLAHVAEAVQYRALDRGR